ncbi:hypothetical protein DBV15_00892 [Temnothorax longispinosus]|uniref:Uncharacterized protein n=1 Tax=Temnothorax longispinosus TaxID=300112 RepID=A0A4S2JC42_9HYME|nr:hypothetical protein DBV15_00892 [Temnothorax longispinosus]
MYLLIASRRYAFASASRIFRSLLTRSSAPVAVSARSFGLAARRGSVSKKETGGNTPPTDTASLLAGPLAGRIIKVPEGDGQSKSRGTATDKDEEGSAEEEHSMSKEESTGLLQLRTSFSPSVSSFVEVFTRYVARRDIHWFFEIVVSPEWRGIPRESLDSPCACGMRARGTEMSQTAAFDELPSAISGV